MGTHSSLSGEFMITPPLPYSIIRGQQRFWPEDESTYVNLADLVELRIIREHEETEVGEITVITADRIQPRGDDRVKAYELEAELTEALAMVPTDGTYQVTSRIDELAETGYRRRYYPQLVEGIGWTVVTVEPRLLWPLAEAGLGEDVIEAQW